MGIGLSVVGPSEISTPSVKMGEKIDISPSFELFTSKMKRNYSPLMFTNPIDGIEISYETPRTMVLLLQMG